MHDFSFKTFCENRVFNFGEVASQIIDHAWEIWGVSHSIVNIIKDNTKLPECYANGPTGHTPNPFLFHLKAHGTNENKFIIKSSTKATNDEPEPFGYGASTVTVVKAPILCISGIEVPVGTELEYLNLWQHDKNIINIPKSAHPYGEESTEIIMPSAVYNLEAKFVDQKRPIWKAVQASYELAQQPFDIFFFKVVNVENAARLIKEAIDESFHELKELEIEPADYMPLRDRAHEASAIDNQRQFGLVIDFVVNLISGQKFLKKLAKQTLTVPEYQHWDSTYIDTVLRDYLESVFRFATKIYETEAESE